MYHGISHPIRSLYAAIRSCEARETNAKLTPRACRWARWVSWSVNIEHPPHGSPSSGNQKW